MYHVRGSPISTFGVTRFDLYRQLLNNLKQHTRRQYSAAAAASGTDANADANANANTTTVTATWDPDAADAGKAGQVYAVAFYANATYIFGSQGWVPWNGGAMLPFRFGALAQGSAVLACVDLSKMAGLEIWLGYGLGSGGEADRELLAAKRYKNVYPQNR